MLVLSCFDVYSLNVSSPLCNFRNDYISTQRKLKTGSIRKAEVAQCEKSVKMYSAIPKSWRNDFGENVTLQELNDALVTLHYPAIVFLCILIIVGVIGNVLVLCVYSKYPPSFFRVFILWLAAIDLIASLVGTPLLVISMHVPYMFPSAQICQSFRFFHEFLVVSSVFIFLFISIERHRAICTIERVEMNRCRVHTMCCVSCGIGIAVAIPAIFVYGNSTVDTGVNNITGYECFIDDKFGDDFLPKSYFIAQLLVWLVSWFIMVVLYIRIGRRLQWHQKFTRSMSFRHPKYRPLSRLSRADVNNGDLNASVESREKLAVSQQGETNKVDRFTREITEMLFIVTVVFVLSFLPHLVLIVLNSLDHNFSRDMTPARVVVYNLFLRSFVVNNAANPVIYMKCQLDFRKDCVKLLKSVLSCKCFSRKK